RPPHARGHRRQRRPVPIHPVRLRLRAARGRRARAARTTRSRLLPVLLSIRALAASGSKGPALAPLARRPAAAADHQAVRAGDEAYIWFTVPSANISGVTPADVASVDLYAYTGLTPPVGSDLTEVAVKVASFPVKPVLPPLPEPPAGAPALPAPPVPPGF